MRQKPSKRYSAITPALASAALFGAATPAAKALLAEISPLVLAGFFYLGSGFVLSLWVLARKYFPNGKLVEPLARADLGWLGAAVFFGGIAGPVLLFTGLASSPASTSAILLNLEGVFTILVAYLFFGEQLGLRLILGILAILAGCAVIGWRGVPSSDGSLLGPLAVAGACLAWAIDNNVTRKISAGDEVKIAAIKGLAAGAVTLPLGLAAGGGLPDAAGIAAAVLVGVAGYGQSLVLFVRSLRNLGAARTAAYFSIAPFVGALLSIVFLGEPVSAALAAGGALVGVGVWLHLTEVHVHEHQHSEPSKSARGEVRERALTIHSHPHYPDIHHRHRH